MTTHNPPRPYRTARYAPLEQGEPVLCTVEHLETRIYADALPLPGVSPASPFFTSAIYTTLDGGNAPLPSTPWDNGHTLMGLTAMWSDPRFSAFRGAGLRTVVLDSGINLDSPFFGPDADGNGVSDRIVYQYDFAMMDGDATDLIGHGSNVAGAMVSSDPTYGGVAPGADIIALRVFNDSGAGNFMYLERALRWVINNATAYNIASVNMSIGDGRAWNSAVTSYNVADELATLAGMGVILTAASGNGFYDGGSSTGVAYPAADPSVLAVGAVYSHAGGGYGYSGGAQATTSPAGAITPFTQRGGLLDILAPGAPIVGPAAGSGLSVMHGTSQAAPQIAGIAVLAQQMAMEFLGRRLGVSEFRQLLVSSARTVIDGDDENDNAVNTGDTYPLVNALGLAEAIWSMRTEATVSQNAAPVLTGMTPMLGGRVDRSAVIDHALLARGANVSDDQGVQVRFIIEKVCNGTLTLNGRLVESEVVVNPGDRLVWTPQAGTEGETAAFRVRAFDGSLASDESADVTITLDRGNEAGFARGLRLASDLPESSPGVESIAVQSSESRLPSVASLRFLDFVSTAPQGRDRGGPIAVDAVFSTVSHAA